MPASGRYDVTMKQAHGKLSKMKQYLSVGMQTCGVVAGDVIETYKDDSGKEKLAEVEDVIMELCKMDQDVMDFTNALNMVEQEAGKLDEDDPVDLEDLLEKLLRQQKEKSKKTQLTEHEEYIRFREGLQEQINNADGATPPDSDSVDLEVEDEDVEISQADVVTKCPITGKEMVNPVKNVKCGHRYDRDGILNHIKLRKGKAKCPIGGCANLEFIQEKHLKEDKELRKYIQRKGREVKKTKKT